MQYTLKELLQLHKVIVPLIQRDYAQGRENQLDLRKGFIAKIKKSLEPNSLPLNLDFIYGYTEKIDNNTTAFIPLDGQQRITTLWLMHWYFAPKEIVTENGELVSSINQDVQDYLTAFTYETRVSSRRFCVSLITKHLPHDENVKLSVVIKDAFWYMASWNNDPTIVSMLNMLDTIQEENFEKSVAWENLVNGRKITFDYIDIKSEEFKLTDELYIKMNSRGKPLTSFESFKAQFSDLLSSKETEYAGEMILFENAQVSYQHYFAFKIDSTWMDLFWSYRARVKEKIDTCLLNYIFYIAEFLYFRDTANALDSDIKRDFDFLAKVFCIKRNTDFLFKSLDFLAGLPDIDTFFSELFNDLSTFDDEPKDYFKRSITNTAFDVKDKTILYAILSYCIKTNNSIPDDELKKFIRIVRNLLLATRQQNQSKRIEYSSNLRFPNVLDYCKFIDGLIKLKLLNSTRSVYELFTENDFIGFSRENIGFEKSKISLINTKPKLQQSIFSLEEHPSIKGNATNFKLSSDDIENKIKAFHEIWAEGVEDSQIIRAFLTVGDYSVITHGYSALGEIRYFGSKNNWNRILTTSDQTERLRITGILDNFLSSYLTTQGQNVKDRLQFMIDSYISITKDWRYYFIKYSAITENPFRDLNLFTWQEDGFNINSIGNSGNQPLSSFHFSPYLIVLKQHFENVGQFILLEGRFSQLGCLAISGLFLTHNINCWNFFLREDKIISQNIIEKYNIIKQDGYYFIFINEIADRIELAIKFIEDLLKEKTNGDTNEEVHV